MKKIIILLIIILYSFALSAEKSKQLTLYYNGKIFSGQKGIILKWFTVQNKVIIKTGNSKLSKTQLHLYKNKINLKGQTVLPGFIDSHIHFIDGSLGLSTVKLTNIKTLTQLKTKLMIAKKSATDGFIFATYLNPYIVKKMSNPRKYLDLLISNIPVILFLDGHKVIMNSKGLQFLSFTKNTKIKNGMLHKDKSGELNGIATEQAAFEANKRISAKFSGSSVQRAIVKGQKLISSYGVTAIGDNTFTPYYYKVYKNLLNRKLLKLKVFSRSFGPNIYTTKLIPAFNVKKLGFIGNDVDTDVLNLYSVKFFVDKSMTPPVEGFANPSFKMDPGGVSLLSQSEIENQILTYKYPLAFHVQGKDGLDKILKARNNTKDRRQLRHIVDHAGYASPAQIKNISDAKLALTVLPYSAFEYKRLVTFYNKQSKSKFEKKYLLNYKEKIVNAKAALTSDWPYAFDLEYKNYPTVDGLSPLAAIAAVVSGKTPDGKSLGLEDNKLLSIEEALQAYTSNGAYAIGKEKSLGQIKKDYSADFIILNKDIFSIKAKDYKSLYDTRVSKTYTNGKMIFEKGSASSRVDEIAENFQAESISKSDYTVSPVFGYDPTLGMLLGAAYFQWPVVEAGTIFNTQTIFTTSGQYLVVVNYLRKKVTPKIDTGFSAYYSNFFDAYYGEGSYSLKSNRLDLNHITMELKPFVNYEFKNNLYFEFGPGIYKRIESYVSDLDGSILKEKRIASDETSIPLYSSISYDNRDFPITPGRGGEHKLTIKYIPTKFSNLKSNDNVLQIIYSSIYFQRLYFPEFIFAAKFKAATTLHGTPSYGQRFMLGGENDLRGYLTNRFRGAHYYTLTGELRFPIFKIVSGVLFLDAGDVANLELSEFGSMKYSYGTGLRFKLTEMAKLRFDFGFQKEGWGIFFTFSEAF